MIKQSEDYILEGRVNPRIRENRLVAWETQSGNIQGRARIKNISLDGMMIETTSDFEPYSNCIFTFDSDLGHSNYIPQNGRLVWHRTDDKRPDKKLCGIQFLNRSEFVTEKLEKRISRFFNKKITFKAASAAADTVGSLMLVALVGFVVWTCYEIYYNLDTSQKQLSAVAAGQAEIARENYRLDQQVETQAGQIATFQNEIISSRQLYSASQNEVVTITSQLAETRSILAQTEALLADAQAGEQQLKADLLALQSEMKDRQSEFEQTLSILENKNQELVEEMRVLDKQLLYYSGNINSIEEGERWFDMYEQRVAKVKDKIRHFRRQAKEVREAAQKERDRIQLVLGNNGYFMKNGRTVNVDMEKYNSVSVDNILATAETSAVPPKSQVEIDVNFFR